MAHIYKPFPFYLQQLSRGPLLALIGVASGAGLAVAIRNPDVQKQLANSGPLLRRWGDRIYFLVLDCARWTLVPLRAIASLSFNVFRLGFASLLSLKNRLRRVPVLVIATSARDMALLPVAAVRNVSLGATHWLTDWLDSRRRVREARRDEVDAALRAPPELEQPEQPAEPEPKSFRIGDLIAARERAMMPDMEQSRERVVLQQPEGEGPEVNEELFEESKTAGRNRPPPSSPFADADEVEEPLATEEHQALHDRELPNPNEALFSTDSRTTALVSETLDGMQLLPAGDSAADDPREHSDVVFPVQRFRLDSRGNRAEADAESASTEDLVDSRRKSALHPETLPEGPAEEPTVRPLESSEEQIRISHEPEPTAVERGELSIAETLKPLGDSLEWARFLFFVV